VPVHQRLNAYALAAGAAGVSMLALTLPSEAEIIYTPANQTIGRLGRYELDLNHDGIIDFVIFEQGQKQFAQGSAQYLKVKPTPNNQVNCRYSFCSSGGVYATALGLGNEIGPGQRPHGWSGGFPKRMASELRSGTFVTYLGDWRYARNNYLGLRFQINGETHFGWARLSVIFHPGPEKERTWEAQLTGYAYETIPGKAIRAGQITDGTGDATGSTNSGCLIPGSFVSTPLSGPALYRPLGMLALGAGGIALLRREESETSGKSGDN
jgi:hypothetical protein